MLTRNIRAGDVITPNIAEFHSIPLREFGTWEPLFDHDGRKITVRWGEICIALKYFHDEVQVLTQNGFVGWSAGRNWMFAEGDA